jgi:lysozyme family protein
MIAASLRTRSASTCSDAPHDPGSKTDYGIIQKVTTSSAGSLPTCWVKLITADKYRTIYYADYRLPICPQFPGLDLDCFDQNVNELAPLHHALADRAARSCRWRFRAGDADGVSTLGSLATSDSVPAGIRRRWLHRRGR